MPRLREVPRKDLHTSADSVFTMLFDDRDPTETPGTGTGTSGNWWSVFAGVPDIFDHAIAGFQMVQNPDRELDPTLRELGQARAGYACGSKFVFSQHCKGCRDAGVREEQIGAIPAWTIANCFTPLERAVLAFTDALALEHGRVSNEVMTQLKDDLSDAAILELTYTVSMYVMHAGISRALRLEYDDVADPVIEIPAPNGAKGIAETLYNVPVI
ncbi:MAG: alkylhydroperoxidase family enzyme [Gammaproteobacteria bacterium]|jgi:alkylhydroperoxidase family enzyme